MSGRLVDGLSVVKPELKICNVKESGEKLIYYVSFDGDFQSVYIDKVSTKPKIDKKIARLIRRWNLDGDEKEFLENHFYEHQCCLEFMLAFLEDKSKK